MKSIKISIVFFAIILIFISLNEKIPFIHAQNPSPSISDNIPSDLSLDLNLAQQNPDPNQNAIVNSEIKQAEIVTSTGDTSVVKPQDTIAPEVKNEPAKDAIHPEQTTSEQIVSIPVVVTVAPVQDQNQSNQNQSPIGPAAEDQNQPGSAIGATGTLPQPSDTAPVSPTIGAGNFVPGTTVVSPDDNAAPIDNSGNPNLPAPTSISTDSTPISTPSDQQSANQPTIQQDQSTQNNNQSGSQNTNQGQPSSDNSQGNQTTSSPADNSSNGSGSDQQTIIIQPKGLTDQQTSPAQDPSQQTNSMPDNNQPPIQPANNPPVTDNNGINQPSQQQSGSNDSGGNAAQPQAGDSTASPDNSGSVQGMQTIKQPNLLDRIIAKIISSIFGKSK